MQSYERTFVGGETIDLPLARRQHAAYEDTLRACGADVLTLDVNGDMSDAVFIEDTALVLDEVAVMLSPGAASRRGEPTRIEPVLRHYRSIRRISLPATIDGGDVVVAGSSIYAGLSRRTNAAGVAALDELVREYGYAVRSVPVTGCLHLKTACSALPDGRFLVNPDWIDASALGDIPLLRVPAAEPWAGDVLVVGEHVIASDAFPRTIELLRVAGFDVMPVPVSEFAKAEGGVTCLSLVFAQMSERSRAMGASAPSAMTPTR